MATDKLDKNCRMDLIIICAKDIGATNLMVHNSEIEKAYRYLVNKTVEAFRDVDSRQ